MTPENWIRISPFLVMLAVAILLAPVISRANKKYAKLAAEMRQKEG